MTKGPVQIGAVLLLALSIGQCSSPTGNDPVADLPIHLAQEFDFIRLTHNDASDDKPVWSPDGKYIVFHSDQDGDLDVYIMDNDGQNLKNLTQSDASDVLPIWSPDGEYIVFISDRDGDHDVYVMDSDGKKSKKFNSKR